MKLSISVACLIIAVAVIGCTTEVPVTVEVEVTRTTEVTREVPVTRVVEVTREAQHTLGRLDLCSDYGYIVELGNRQLEYLTVALEVARRSLPSSHGAIEFGETNLERVHLQVRTAKNNSSAICGVRSVRLAPLYEMKTLEGWGVCVETIRIFDLVYEEPWEQLGKEFEDSMFALLDGYSQYCDNEYLD